MSIAKFLVNFGGGRGVLQVTMTVTPMLPTLASEPPTDRFWFSNHGCVVRGETRWQVWVGGTLVGVFEPRDKARRNTILIGLVEGQRVHRGRLARAFGISEETVRAVQRRFEAEGVRGLVPRASTGRPPKVKSGLRRTLWKMFDHGASVANVVEKFSRTEAISEVTLRRERARWKKKRSGSPVDETSPASVPVAPPTPPEQDTSLDVHEGDDVGEPEEVVASPVVSGRQVQHLGTWLMMALVHEAGLYESAMRVAGQRVAKSSVRVVLDAVVAALTIGQQCVEGVRRLATTSAPVLLRAAHAPSASWARRVLGKLAMKTGGARLQLAMAGHYLREASAAADGEPVVFYVDNHLRPYTGKHTVRKGWRMQARRVVPGISDYYVHDVDGRPILRKVVPDHLPLTSVLTSIGELLRLALPEDTILLVFDRAGSFPEQLAELRDANFEFATYERRPYPLLARSAFDESMHRRDEKLLLHESRHKNLRGGRGRVRRIAVRNSEGYQLNVLAISEQPAAWLVDVMLGRWTQENAFKHGVERWGINQLDSRTVEHYEPQTVIPNPARRRLDHALRVARVREGDALRQLERLDDGDPRREPFERQLEEARQHQADLEAQRPSMPTHAPLEETELAGELVYHSLEYKHVLDTLRIACANAESELAALLGPHLPKPCEAKRVLQNLFTAPGHVQLNGRSITVTLLPAADSAETEAIHRLLCAVSQRKLTLPGDHSGRVLRFQAQTV